MGERFEYFKKRVSNVKNQAISASTEALSNKVRNFSDAIETGRQNIHNTLDSLGNKNWFAFVTVDDVPVDLEEMGGGNRSEKWTGYQAQHVIPAEMSKRLVI